VLFGLDEAMLPHARGNVNNWETIIRSALLSLQSHQDHAQSRGGNGVNRLA
jgi:hypothetical protein